MAPLELLRLTAVGRESINWIWPVYIPGGKLTMFDGDPNFKRGRESLFKTPDPFTPPAFVRDSIASFTMLPVVKN